MLLEGLLTDKRIQLELSKRLSLIGLLSLQDMGAGKGLLRKLAGRVLLESKLEFWTEWTTGRGQLRLVIYGTGYCKMSDCVAKQLSTERISDCWERVTGKLGEGSYDIITQRPMKNRLLRVREANCLLLVTNSPLVLRKARIEGS